MKCWHMQVHGHWLSIDRNIAKLYSSPEYLAGYLSNRSLAFLKMMYSRVTVLKGGGDR